MKTLDPSERPVLVNGRYHPLAYITSRIFDPAVTKILTGIAFLMLVQVEPAWLATLLIGDLFIPLCYFTLSLRRGSISDIDITKRKERIPYYTVLAVCWTTTLFIIWQLGDIPPEILLMQAWFAVFGILNVSITYFWKISGHMMAATGLVMWLSLLWSPIFLLLLITFIPLVAWSRLSMRKHTLAQVVAGTCLMIVIVLAMRSFFALT